MLLSSSRSDAGSMPFLRMAYSNAIYGTPPLRPGRMCLPASLSQVKLASFSRPTKKLPSHFVTCANTSV